MLPKNNEKVPQLRFANFSDEWKQYKVSGLTDNTYGGGTPKTAVEHYWNGEIPWIQSSDIIEHQLYNVIPKKHISKDAVSNSAAKIIPENSIAIVSRVGIGKLAIMPFSYTTSQDFLSLSNLKTDIDFTVYILYDKLQNGLNSAQGTSIKGITKDEMLSKEIMVPTFAEQRKIGKYFKSLDNLITLHQNKMDNLKKIKAIYLKLMFI